MDLNVTTVALISTVIGAVATYLAARIAARESKKAADNNTAVTFSSNLMQRLDRVESKVEKLEIALEEAQSISRIAVSYIDRLLMWIIARNPSTDIPPVPTQLSEHVSIIVPNDRSTP